MLCIYRDNNPSLGKFYEIKTKSSSDGFIETQSSLSNSFKIGEYDETGGSLRPLISTISLSNIYEIESDRSLPSFLSERCAAKIQPACLEYVRPEICPVNSTFNGFNCSTLDDETSFVSPFICGNNTFLSTSNNNNSYCHNETKEIIIPFFCSEGYKLENNKCVNGSDWTNPYICPEGYLYNGTACRDDNDNLTDAYLTICDDEYYFNGTYCVSNCSDNFAYQVISDTILYQENRYGISFNCTLDNSIENVTSTDGFDQDIYIKNITCLDSTNCTAQFENSSQRFLTKDSAQPALLSVENKENWTRTLYLSFEWPRNENAVMQPRGYYFSDEILDENEQPIQINASIDGNSCSSGKTSLRFGMNIDFTCMTDIPINRCNLTNSTIFEDYDMCDLSSLSNYTNSTSIRQIPYSDGQDDDTIPFPSFDYDPNISEIVENSSIIKTNETDNNIYYTVDSLFLTGITRSINIFYKTIGYEKNPTHIIMSADADYDYSTSVKYLNSNFVQQYRNITLRTVVRFFEYPNNLNMFKGSSTNTKVQSWLPFEV